jgi:hypothetical protein
MSLETLDLRWIMRRIWTAIGVVAVCGLLAGIAVAALHPLVLTSTALIALPQSPLSAEPAAATTGGTDPYTATQEVIATSSQVLVDALPTVRPVMSLDQLRHDVQAGSPESRAAFESYRQDPALADLHPHRERGTSAYVWHLFDRLDDLRPLLRP